MKLEALSAQALQPEQTLALAREALERGHRVRLRIHGRSMAPALRSGQRIEIRPGAEQLRRGEVVACAQGKRLVVHRVVAVRGDGVVVTRGDGRNLADPPNLPADVLGRVVLADGRPVPRARRLRRLLRAIRRRLHAP